MSISKSTARYFAEQAYKLLLTHGKAFSSYTNRDGNIVECWVGIDTVDVFCYPVGKAYTDWERITVKIAKAWGRF